MTAPVFVSPIAFDLAEGTLIAAQLIGADRDFDTLSYAITGGDDAAWFSIDADSGLIRFLVSPDFEAPSDADGDNAYRLTVSVSDGTTTLVEAITVTVLDVDEPVALTGTAGDDKLVGSALDEVLSGGAGDDRYFGGGGTDVFALGAGGEDKVLDFTAGTDLLDLSDWGTQALSELVITTKSGKMFLQDAISGDRAVVVLAEDLAAEEVSAEMFVFAPVTDQVLTGGAGVDILKGRAGNDTLDGGAGADSYWGGEGADTFVIGAARKADRVRDWQDGQDVLDLTSWDLSSEAALIIKDRGDGRFVIKDDAGHRVQVETSDIGLGVEDLGGADFLI